MGPYSEMAIVLLYELVLSCGLADSFLGVEEAINIKYEPKDNTHTPRQEFWHTNFSASSKIHSGVPRGRKQGRTLLGGQSRLTCDLTRPERKVREKRDPAFVG